MRDDFYGMKSRSYCAILISVFIVSAFCASSEKKISHERHGLNKLQQCPCDAAELCSKSKKGVVLCNCWTQCNAECPFGFDRIDETTESCGYGDTRNMCSTNIVCDKAKHHGASGSVILDKGMVKGSDSSESNDGKKDKGKKDKSKVVHGDVGDEDDDDYLKLSIVGFILWQIGSVGLGMMICGCAQDCVRYLENTE